jgi:methyl-accepting chemotaxis protein
MSQDAQWKNRRRHYLINKPFQFGYLWRHALIGLLALAGSIVLIFFLFMMQFSQNRVYHGPWSEALAWNVALLALLLVAFAVYRGIMQSHRIAGPAYHLSRICRKIIKGDLSEKVHLRKHDQLKDLADDFNTMIEHLREGIDQDRQTVRQCLDELHSMQIAAEEIDHHATRERFLKHLSSVRERLNSIGASYVTGSEIEKSGDNQNSQ